MNEINEEVKEKIKEKVKDDIGNDIWDSDGRCKFCGAGDNYHHSWSCPTELHVDKIGRFEA